MERQARTVVITGASRGIGEATARLFGEQGDHVVLAARSAGDIERIAGEIRERGGSATAVKCDVARYEDVRALVRHALDKHGRIDLLVNNAAIIEPIAQLAESDPEAWALAVDVNFKGVYHGLREVIPAMLEQGGGTIVNISSGAASNAIEGWSAYCSTKAGVLSLTRCVHGEYGDRGIRIVGLSPGTVATDMQRTIKASGINPVSQLDFSVHIPPEWVARTIDYLAGSGGDAWLGTDFSLKTNEGRTAVGLPMIE
ncbi:MAG: SDR family oxidoreductase [Geminicoccaceae bacterium]|nr:SDR family oxidoreductase [Geminicoccaceae bacterium]